MFSFSFDCFPRNLDKLDRNSVPHPLGHICVGVQGWAAPPPKGRVSDFWGAVALAFVVFLHLSMLFYAFPCSRSVLPHPIPTPHHTTPQGGRGTSTPHIRTSIHSRQRRWITPSSFQRRAPKGFILISFLKARTDTATPIPSTEGQPNPTPHHRGGGFGP